MSEDDKQEQQEQELNADQLEEVAGGLCNNEVIEGVFKFVKAPRVDKTTPLI